MQRLYRDECRFNSTTSIFKSSLDVVCMKNSKEQNREDKLYALHSIDLNYYCCLCITSFIVKTFFCLPLRTCKNEIACKILESKIPSIFNIIWNINFAHVSSAMHALYDGNNRKKERKSNSRTSRQVSQIVKKIWKNWKRQKKCSENFYGIFAVENIRNVPTQTTSSPWFSMYVRYISCETCPKYFFYYVFFWIIHKTFCIIIVILFWFSLYFTFDL